MEHFQKALTLTMALLPSCWAVEKRSVQQLTEMANSHSPGLQEAITATFDPKDLREGMASIGRGTDFFFAIQATSQPSLIIDDASGPEMQQVTGSNLWYAPAHLEPTGQLHSFRYMLQGASFGGRLDLPAYGPLSYLQPGVSSGTLSAKIMHTSKIFDGMKSEYWVYVPAQYDPKVPAALMVFQETEAGT